MKNDENNSNSGLGCAMLLLAIVFVMPLAGLYFMAAGENEDDKIIGFILFILGIILWGYVLLHN